MVLALRLRAQPDSTAPQRQWRQQAGGNGNVQLCLCTGVMLGATAGTFLSEAEVLTKQSIVP